MTCSHTNNELGHKIKCEIPEIRKNLGNFRMNTMGE